MRRRIITLVACLSLAAVLGGCQMLRRSGSGRPTREQIAGMLASGTFLKEIAYGDLNGDDHDEALVAATLPGPDGQAAGIVFARDRRGRYAPVLQRILAGEGWLPI